MLPIYREDPNRILETIEDLHSCLDSHEVALKTLEIMSSLFRFDFLMLAVLMHRTDGVWFEGKICAGNCPQGLVGDTRRLQSLKRSEDEDILWHVYWERQIVRVDPLDKESPIFLKIHAPTAARYEYTDPIYFIPLRDKAGEVRAIIHASLPRTMDPGLTPLFEKHLRIVASNAGLSIANSRLHSGAELQRRQHEALLAARSLLDRTQNPDQDYLVILSILTVLQNFAYNRAFLFIRGMQTSTFRAQLGIAPLNAADLAAVQNIPSIIEEILDHPDTLSPKIVYKRSELEPLYFDPLSDVHLARCVDTRCVVLMSGTIRLPIRMSEPFISNPFGCSGPFALLPLTIDSHLVGLIYIDNLFTEGDLQSLDNLEALATSLSNLLAAAWRRRERERINATFAKLIHSLDGFLDEQTSSITDLFHLMLESARSLGASRAAVVRLSLSDLEYELKWTEPADDDNHSKWTKTLTDLFHPRATDDWCNDLSIQRLLTRDGSPILTRVLPFQKQVPGFFLCVECSDPQLTLTSEFTNSISTLAFFFSALIASSEITAFREHSIDDFLAASKNTFSNEITHITLHEAKTILASFYTLIEQINREPGRLTAAERSKFSDLEKGTVVCLNTLDTYRGFADTLDKNAQDSETFSALQPVVNQVTRSLSARFLRRKGCSSDSLVVEIEPVEVRMSSGGLLITLHNLLSNAIKATQNTETPRIAIKATYVASRNEVQIRVIDNGCGITADDRNRLFTLGYSGFLSRELANPNRASASQRSCGIGLFGIRKLIQDRYHGRINLTCSNGLTEALVILPGRLTK
ncbi:MAG: ATP-binding protein [Verrucomicrobia bacterium]|nr:ATP-binding protein [Verrucomicrobiota bacterium]